jgi:hypothetical protein
VTMWFLGNKIEIDYVLKTVKFTQPVLLQSLKDEFVLKKGKVKLLSHKGEGVKYLNPEKQCDCRSDVGKPLHLSKWSRPDMFENCHEE